MADCGASGDQPSYGRSLKTAAEALQALHMLGDSAEGLTAEALACRLGKSPATARYLLNTLCQEGYATKDPGAGVFRLVSDPPWGRSWGGGELSTDDLTARLSDAVTELYWRTRQRSYLARWQEGETVILDARGHQGLAKIPGLTEHIPMGQSHALAVTKALVAMSTDLQDELRHAPALAQFTGSTVISSGALEIELARTRRDGVAYDREEFAEGFCCVAAPILDPRGRVAASIALSTPARRFASCSMEMTNAVLEVAATASQHWREQEPELAPLASPAGEAPEPPHDGAPADRWAETRPGPRRR